MQLKNAHVPGEVRTLIMMLHGRPTKSAEKSIHQKMAKGIRKVMVRREVEKVVKVKARMVRAKLMPLVSVLLVSRMFFQKVQQVAL